MPNSQIVKTSKAVISKKAVSPKIDITADLDAKQLLKALRAYAKGDFTQRLPLDQIGIAGEIAIAFNQACELSSDLEHELERLNHQVGKEGKITQRATLTNAPGSWANCVNYVNSMVGDLVRPTTEVARVIGAVAKGDLSQTMPLEIEGFQLKGEFLKLAKTINTMVDQLGSFASEVTRVAREVGTDGKLGGQAYVKGVSGTWKDLTDSVNSMASNLTNQVRNIADVTTAVATGDLSKKITVDVRGEILELKNTINTMVDQLSSFSSEVTRVAREVGTEGKLGGQAYVKGISGTWKDLTDSVNSMASNLTSQVRNIASVTTAVATGDLSKTITVDVKGEILELKNTINTMVDQLSSFASEVTRVAREVGTEGKLGGQAYVKGVSGTWKDLTDSVNSMASNLTEQVRGIADVTTAVATGDLSKKISVDVKGEILELKNTINTMVDQLSSFASEVTRVAREVGTEGKLGGQAYVKGISGTWKDLTDSVNSMASNLTEQVRGLADVTTAVATGDLSKKITVDVKGEILELKNTINTMVDQLSSFASEVTRVAREVGTEGKLGGQADVKGVSGTWKDLTDSVNSMASNLTNQVRNIADVTTAVASGDLSKKITVDVKGEILELKNTINTMVDQLGSFSSEVTRVAREVGTEGKLGGQAYVKGVSGTWKDLTDSVNSMASNLTNQVRNIADVTTAVANGDLSKQITVDVKGEILELKNTINTMVDQLSSFASEVTRVAREVGTEGKLGGQAYVKGVSGTWKDLTDSVNVMASNLTEQVRGIAVVVSAVASGNLKRKLVLTARGEIAELADTINEMIDTLATFAEQVTTVAREVGVEGVLGGQARVPGASGTWKDLTDNVNQLAANLTTQVRAISEVSTAVTKGDLTRSISVKASGEVALLKDNINEMIRNLKDTTQKNTEQDWLKTNLAKFTKMLQGQRDLLTVANLVLAELAPLVEAQLGVFYIKEENDLAEPELRLLGSYAYQRRRHLSDRYGLREGIIGQCAVEKQRILLLEIPDDYIKISSGLGEARPVNLVVLPVLFEGEIRAIIELASFNIFSDIHLTFLDQLTEGIGIVINTIEANMRTENLLIQSQSLARELQQQQQELTETNKRLEQQALNLQASEERLYQQQEELRTTNEDLEEKARLLGVQNSEVETKNREIEQARLSMLEKAEQLSLASKYKSEFLANMSHELRTPLNSLLILSQMLADNMEGNLSAKQIDFARTIYNAGSELLALINDILDLSKIESGTMSLEISEVNLEDLLQYAERNFSEIANDKKLSFIVGVKNILPKTIFTDSKRLMQIIKNLLSNAFKFTERGSVTLQLEQISSKNLNLQSPTLLNQDHILAFRVIDTGIGIPNDKHGLIFEAFQQADGSTNRKYGGTGLGLPISREIARILGGEIHLYSKIQEGSVFTLYLPRVFTGHSVSDSLTLLGKLPEPTITPKLNLEMPAQTLLKSDLIKDDRLNLLENDQLILLVEDDLSYANLFLTMLHEIGLKGIVVNPTDNVFKLLDKFAIKGIILDTDISLADGWALFDQLKHKFISRHLPIYIISSQAKKRRVLSYGALGLMQKPASPDQIKGVILKLKQTIEQNSTSILLYTNNEYNKAYKELLECLGSEMFFVENPDEILNVAIAKSINILILARQFEVNELITLLEALYNCEKIDKLIIIIAGFDLVANTFNENELEDLAAKYSDKIILKLAKSKEYLLDLTALFLHKAEASLPNVNRQMLEESKKADPILSNKTVLIVDDDIRNIYAITAILEKYHMNILSAENGYNGIEILKNQDNIDIVLMDIMMPELDGYKTIKKIRELEKFHDLPIIALTAKAMKGDKEKCLDAGASDYIAKPVDIELLLSLLRVWLYNKIPSIT